MIEEYNFDELQKSFSKMILSASGFRKVFAISEDEEDATKEISNLDKISIAVLAKTFSNFIYDELKKDNITIAVATDTRPTRETISKIIIDVCSNLKINVIYFASVCAPEIMAHVKITDNIDGLVYISASHNPIGHNGFKFCLGDGAVLEPSKATKLISNYKSNMLDKQFISESIKCANTKNNSIDTIFSNIENNKVASEKSYFKFSEALFSFTDDEKEIIKFREKLLSLKKELSIVADFNGSARCLSIDVDFFKKLGIFVYPVGNIPGEISHRIVPEGISLEPCKEILESKYKKDPSFLIGYVPDNDGDRGNIVYIDKTTQQAKVLEAQQVFALSVLSELAFVEYSKGKQEKIAVAVNCCTSERIVDIAKYFNAKVFRAEVGEANVVNLAANLRKDGYLVRILGEGSNGGNITYPATVRDPLNTVGAIVKLIYLPDLFKLWCEKLNIKFDPNYTLKTIIDTLPKYSTTSAFEKEAQIKINTTDHAKLKASYETIFPSFWNDNRDFLKKELGIEKYEIVNYEGVCEKRGEGKQFRSGLEKGGFKVEFFNSSNEIVAFIWMRGSGTEPVFRILAEVKGDNDRMQLFLLEKHREIIKKADV